MVAVTPRRLRDTPLVAPEIEGEDIHGVPFKLSDYRGKVVMIDFWAHSFPGFMSTRRSLVTRLSGKPFAILGISGDSDRKKLKEMVKQEETSWRVWWDGGSPNGPIATKWNVSVGTVNYLLDGKGIIRFKNTIGPALDKAIDTLLKEVSEKG